MPPALIALAPVIASGVQQVVKHKQAKSAEKKQASYDQQLAQNEAAANQAQFESSQNSPAALAKRQSFTMQLGKLLGKAGGKEKIPPSIYNYLQQGRQAQQFTPGPGYVPKPTSGAGLWDVVGGAGQALSYLDTTKLGGRPKLPAPTGFGAGSSFATGQVQKLLAPQNPADNPLAVTRLNRTPWGG